MRLYLHLLVVFPRVIKLLASLQNASVKHKSSVLELAIIEVGIHVSHSSVNSTAFLLLGIPNHSVTAEVLRPEELPKTLQPTAIPHSATLIGSRRAASMRLAFHFMHELGATQLRLVDEGFNAGLISSTQP
eukprot:GHVS01017341.1.p1 GENE.GHVS01017341.1~~GHVS01017341.1.p1  ORF type:complete len:131 (+),score=1.77 GHVS01017341.1:412-804(+)